MPEEAFECLKRQGEICESSKVWKLPPPPPSQAREAPLLLLCWRHDCRDNKEESKEEKKQQQQQQPPTSLCRLSASAIYILAPCAHHSWISKALFTPVRVWSWLERLGLSLRNRKSEALQLLSKPGSVSGVQA